MVGRSDSFESSFSLSCEASGAKSLADQDGGLRRSLLSPSLSTRFTPRFASYRGVYGVVHSRLKLSLLTWDNLPSSFSRGWIPDSPVLVWRLSLLHVNNTNFGATPLRSPRHLSSRYHIICHSCLVLVVGSSLDFVLVATVAAAGIYLE